MHLAVFFRVASVARYCGHMIAGSLLGTTLGMFSSCFSIYYSDVIMSTMASQITSLTIVYSRLLYSRPTKLEGGVYWIHLVRPSVLYSGVGQRKYQSSVSLAFVRGIHQWPVNSPHKGPVMQKMFPFDDFIMQNGQWDLEKSHCTSKVNSYTCIYEPGHHWFR